VDSGGVVGDLVGSSGGDNRGDDSGRGGSSNFGHGRHDGGHGGGNGSDLRGGRAHGVRGGSSGVGRGSGSVGRRSSNGGRRRDHGSVVGDAELSGVLVLAGRVVDELDTVALGALGGDEGRLDVPGVAAGVGDLLGDGLDELEVLGRALEEDQRNGALGSGVP
jgi:hypothetical protein